MIPICVLTSFWKKKDGITTDKTQCCIVINPSQSIDYQQTRKQQTYWLLSNRTNAAIILLIQFNYIHVHQINRTFCEQRNGGREEAKKPMTAKKYQLPNKYTNIEQLRARTKAYGMTGDNSSSSANQYNQHTLSLIYHAMLAAHYAYALIPECVCLIYEILDHIRHASYCTKKHTQISLSTQFSAIRLCLFIVCSTHTQCPRLF